MSKHLTRIRTGLLLGVLAIVSVFYFPNALFALMCWLMVMAAFWEWLVLVHIKQMLSRIILLLIFGVMLFLMRAHLMLVLHVSLVWWGVALLLLFFPKKHLAFLKNKIIAVLMAFVVLQPLFVSVVVLHEQKPLILFYLIMLVSFADTGAYFIGSRYGRHPLLPRVSPKKSFEGLLGGLVVGTLAGLLEVLFMPDLSWQKLLSWTLLGVVLILVSVLGDLFESLIKRFYDAKDSGSLLPGHGGFLDRLDSQTSAMPIFLFLCLTLHLFY